MSRPPRSHSRHSRAPGQTSEQAAHLYNQGVTLQAEGKTTLAESAFRRAVSKQPEFAEAHNNLGNILLEQGKYKAAEKSFRRALQLLPDNVMLQANIGKALARQGKTATALDVLKAANNLEPQSAVAIHTMGTVLMQTGKVAEAIGQFERARELRPDSPEIAGDLGAALYKQERYQEAVEILHATVKTYPGYFDAYPNLAEAAFKIGAVDDAIKVLHEALKIAPKNDVLCFRLAEIQHARQDFLSARTAISRALDINPRNPDYYNLLSKILYKMNLTVAATDMARKAIALRPDKADYHHSLSIALMLAGNRQEARQSFRRTIRLQADLTYSHLMLAQITQHLTFDEDMHAMETLLSKGHLSDQQASRLHFGLGKSYDDLGDYAKAAEHYSLGNTLIKIAPDGGHDAGRLFHKLATAFSREHLQQHLDSGYRGVKPVFITGLPRAGKTVVETILARHPLVRAGGESGEFQQVADKIVASSTGAGFADGIPKLETSAYSEIGRGYAHCLQQRLDQVDYTTNTSPGIVHYIGMLRLCLPDAKVILCVREAGDVCTEIYKKNLSVEHHYSHDLQELGNYYLQHRDLMEHWCRLLPDFIHVVPFEELLRDHENRINALLDFCGLPREEDCLNTDSLPRAEDSIGLWQHYREPFKPLFDKLES